MISIPLNKEKTLMSIALIAIPQESVEPLQAMAKRRKTTPEAIVAQLLKAELRIERSNLKAHGPTADPN